MPKVEAKVLKNSCRIEEMKRLIKVNKLAQQGLLDAEKKRVSKNQMNSADA
jgi:hypothetical protein